jgi:hypothetical protein
VGTSPIARVAAVKIRIMALNQSFSIIELFRIKPLNSGKMYSIIDVNSPKIPIVLAPTCNDFIAFRVAGCKTPSVLKFVTTKVGFKYNDNIIKIKHKTRDIAKPTVAGLCEVEKIPIPN